MLIEANYRGRAKSRYICDRCKTELQGVDERYRISAWIMPEEKRLKRWDFCRQML